MKTDYIEIVTANTYATGVLSLIDTIKFPFDGFLALIDWSAAVINTTGLGSGALYLSLSGDVTLTQKSISTLTFGWFQMATPETFVSGVTKVVPLNLPVRKDGRLYISGYATNGELDGEISLHFRK